MKTLFSHTRTFILLLFFVVGAFASEAHWSDLTPEQQATMNEGKQLLIEENIPGAAWPCFHVYQIINASPCEVTALFWDIYYDIHYIPDCLKVVVNGRPASNIVDATYDLKMPIFPNEVTKVRNEVTALPDGSYRNSWEILSSKYSQSGKGSFLVMPYGKGSFVCYSNFVVPKSCIAGLLKGSAEQHVKSTVAAIATQSEYEVKFAPAQLAKQIKELNTALGK